MGPSWPRASEPSARSIAVSDAWICPALAWISASTEANQDGRTVRTLASLVERITAGQSPYGGVEGTGRAVRFARLIHRPVRVLGGPSARAAFGGNLSLLEYHVRW